VSDATPSPEPTSSTGIPVPAPSATTDPDGGTPTAAPTAAEPGKQHGDPLPRASEGAEAGTDGSRHGYPPRHDQG
jgi:hypothetical protein